MTLDKAQRIALLISRLEALPNAASGDEMLAQLSTTQHAVEDEHSGVLANPNAADALVDDGRMYPPDERFLDPIPGRPDIARYRHRKGHVTFIRDNGAIRIELRGQPIIDKPGADGRTVF